MYRKGTNVYLFSWDISLFLLVQFVSQMKTFVFQMAIKKLKLKLKLKYWQELITPKKCSIRVDGNP